jgi:membrane protease YdiL (CAAX protease family)
MLADLPGVAGSVTGAATVQTSAMAAVCVTYLLICLAARSTLPFFAAWPARRVWKACFRLLIFALPVAVMPWPSLSWRMPAVIIGVATGLIGLGLQADGLARWFGRGSKALLAPVAWRDRVADLLISGGSGIGQETFYRGFLIMAFAPVLKFGVVILAAALFLLEHLVYRGARKDWDRRDMFWHVGMSIVLGWSVYLTGSIIGAYMAHTLYNLPAFAIALRRPTDAAPRRKGTATHARTT